MAPLAILRCAAAPEALALADAPVLEALEPEPEPVADALLWVGVGVTTEVELPETSTVMVRLPTTTVFMPWDRPA